jgi:predicted RNase H-related nuclease YkuK (DUF458 family)
MERERYFTEWIDMSDGSIIDDLRSHIEDSCAKVQDPKIYVGCDSSNYGRFTIFATAIVIHAQGKGGHVIYCKESVPRIRSREERLWREVELSVAATKEMSEIGVRPPDFIDVDLNPNPKYPSNQLLASAVGLVESLGIKTRWKSNSPWSISVADVLCR